ncbi:MAG: GNAT family N-acetyltransferase [Chitinophagales bacterium]|jgi:ribosomal protein S18 acetylase RimI-like enzyme|nr:GNAT family N-acetyltransferase [Sphingobacteriales bacterium]
MSGKVNSNFEFSVLNFEYNFTKTLSAEKVEELYIDSRWTNYTNDLPKLMRGIANSLDVISVWDGEKLVGLIRTIGDGETIIYIQDILVLKAYKRQGIGRHLMKQILDKYEDVRQIILLTDSAIEQKAFYESMGMKDCSLSDLKTFMKV